MRGKSSPERGERGGAVPRARQLPIPIALHLPKKRRIPLSGWL